MHHHLLTPGAGVLLEPGLCGAQLCLWGPRLLGGLRGNSGALRLSGLQEGAGLGLRGCFSEIVVQRRLKVPLSVRASWMCLFTKSLRLGFVHNGKRMIFCWPLELGREVGARRAGGRVFYLGGIKQQRGSCLFVLAGA